MGARLLGVSVRDKVTCFAVAIAHGQSTCSSGGEPAVRPFDELAGAKNLGQARSDASNPPFEWFGGAYHRFDNPLFVVGHGDAAAVSPRDIHQGVLGDCLLLASIGAVAARRPDLVQGMTKYNGDGTYTVTLHEASKLGFYQYEHGSAAIPAPPTPTKSVVVTPEFPVGFVDRVESWAGVEPTPLFARPGDRDAAGKGEIWPLLMEKAYAKEHGGYAQLEKGSSVEALSALTGEDVAAFGRPEFFQGMDAGEPITFDDLNRAWQAGDAIVAASLNDDQAKKNPLYTRGPWPLVSNHGYMVTAVDPATQTVTIRNPWGGSNADTTLTWAQYQSATIATLLVPLPPKHR